MNGRSREVALLATTTLASLWVSAWLPLSSQEAYYWLYAQHPALSYFDHPPMDAWWIWIGTHLLGNGALGVRIGTILSGLTTALLGLALLRRFDVGERGRALWLIATVTVPALFATRFLANPDPPLLVFWTATMLALWCARNGDLRWWLAAGAAAGAAGLSKYSAAFLLPSGIAILTLDPKMRTQLRSVKPYLAVLVAAVVFLPVLAWNVSHDFASFRFQTARRYAGVRFAPGRVFEFAGIQTVITNPLFLPIVALTGLWLWRQAKRRDMRAIWLLAFALPIPLYMLANSPFMRIKANWLTPAYVPLGLAAACWFQETRWTTLRATTRRLAILGCVIASATILLSPLSCLLPANRGSTLNGWPEVARSARKWQRAYRSDRAGAAFYFAADYKDAAQLSHALATLAPPAPPVLAQNVFGRSALQFNYWQHPRDFVGKTAIFVLPRANSRPAEIEKVRGYFARLERLETVRVRRLGVSVIEAAIFACHDYRGPSRSH